MPNKNYETHSNSEPIRKCPYCDWEGASRGLTFHVLNKADEEHGEKYDQPETFDASNAEIVGYKDVDVEMPEEYDIDKDLRYVCDYCGKVCKGKGGIGVHLSTMEGDEAHPDDATDRDADSFPTFKVSEDGDLIAQDDESLTVATGGADSITAKDLEPQEVVPIEELKQLRTLFMDQHNDYENLSPLGAVEMVDDIIERYE